MENEKKLLEIIDLYTFFDTKRGTVKAVNNVSYTVEEGTQTVSNSTFLTIIFSPIFHCKSNSKLMQSL